MQEMGAVRAFHIIDGDLLDRRERLRGRVRRLRMPVELLMRVILWRVLLLRVRIRLLILLLCIQVLLVLGDSPLLFFERDLLMVVSKTLSFGLALLLFLPGAKTVQLLEFPWLEILWYFGCGSQFPAGPVIGGSSPLAGSTKPERTSNRSNRTDRSHYSRDLTLPVPQSIPSGHAREISEHNPADPAADVRTSSYTFATLDLGSQ
ncbi:hypothetical protein CEJ39_04025 [Rhodococcus pyridinivorans]|nr:hypothetical protein CEJ39_04025 [Rhodococcus pyridinivorans]